ncbi:Re/Si-specific NAD(P)(+) transhydrogenase subunit alpha [Arsenicicoccus sp. oral taxon 190]|uniref:Re/Si-specific NAD(P)(+) transhydrogenase subunit alpha n=1 Tax=Arsenicicoccus sp. oral taxon 190 TaxID=1658671 RepID=UPI00067A3773|nr:Re/Si-specific NAD(P)(+) transhydrogenase subunit alpha [Arsenicicoccus sp. oral taxon 190]AKT50500.1 NAD(P) transhydrogenase subunit alpha [Arsenicicoccus sp. oral taxon 190]
MQIGIPRETVPGETRVAATPTSVEQLVRLGYDVVVETGAGALASVDDRAYADAGATVAERATTWAADAVYKINAPTRDELDQLREGATLVSLVGPALHPELLQELAARRLTVLATDAVPRISRAQALDVLSSMANISGYRAVVEAAHEFGRFFTGQVTAAGKVPPATVLVAGAGVAGLSAIGTAVSLGAVVRATDARAEVAEQVESMGGEFLHVDVGEQQVSTDGYARETSEAYDVAARRLYAEAVPASDIVITTALIPGRPAPRLITADMVAAMRPGSVIVDMAAATGGNVEGSVPDQKVVTDHGVTIIGYTDLPARLPGQASQLYATNLVNLTTLITPGKDGQMVLDMEDVVQRGMTVVLQGEVLWPPPPIRVSAAPPPATGAGAGATAGGATVAAPPEAAAPRPRAPYVRPVLAVLGLVAFLALAASAPPSFLGHFMVFMLACVVGYYVIGNVHHALHTPLMSVTNAISGIIIVGALAQLGRGDLVVNVLAFAAVLVASINIFGGFTVTQRMLSMFRRG